MKKKKIAFVHYPHWPGSARLDTLPFALNLLRRLAGLKCDIDLFLWEQPDLTFASKLPGNVTVHYRKLLGRRFTSVLHPSQLIAQFSLKRAYDCTFSVGQIGSFIGGLVSAASRCPLVLLNDEFPSCWPQGIWTKLERWAAMRSSAIILPSGGRIDELLKELHIPCKKHFVFANITSISDPVPEVNWHQEFNIPANKKIFLQAGTLGDWAQGTELLCSVPYWPEGTVLLLHSRTDGGSTAYRKQISHLDTPSRIFWSEKQLPENLLNSLTSYCAGTFALYRDTGPNIATMGMSSGKLMRSIACGTPVITSALEFLNFVTQERVGIQVRHPSEIPDAIAHLMLDIMGYRERCLSFAASQRETEDKTWDDLIEYLNGDAIGEKRPKLAYV